MAKNIFLASLSFYGSEIVVYIADTMVSTAVRCRQN